MEPEDCQGRSGGASRTTRRRSGTHPPTHSPARALQPHEEEPGGGRPGSVTDPAAHRGAQHRGVPLGADPRWSRAADGGPTGGGVPAL